MTRHFKLFLVLISVLVHSLLSFASEESRSHFCADKRNVVIATEGTKFEPFKSFKPIFKKNKGIQYEIGKRPTGFEVDLLQAIFRKMKCYKPQFIHNYDSVGVVKYKDLTTNQFIEKSKGPIDFAALFPSLSYKRVDQEGNSIDKYAWDMTIATTGIKQERRDKFGIEFSKSYFTPRKHFFGTTTINTIPDDLAGKIVGVKANTLFAAYIEFLNSELVKKGLEPIDMVTFDDSGSPAYDKIFEAMKKSELDYTLNDDELLLDALANDPNLGQFDLVGPDLIQSFGGDKFGEGVGVAFRKDDTKFINDFNAALKKVIQNCDLGGYKWIYDKYFNAPSSLIAHCE